MILDFLIFAITGRILIFLFQKFPKEKLPFIGTLFLEGKFLEELFSCDLCLGFWVYFGLAFIFGDFVPTIDYVPILSEFITGAITTFIVHIFSVGWNAKFQNFIIE
jgi:hypothetical protein